MCSIQTIEMPSRAKLVHRLDQLLHLRLGQAACDLVQQQHAGPRGERPRELEPLALEQRQRARQRVRPVERAASRSSASTQRLRTFRPLLPRAVVAPTSTFSYAVRPPNGRGIWNVLAMPARQCSCPGDPGDVAPVEEDAPAVGAEAAGDQAQKRRLAGPVRPHDPERLALVELEADVLDRPRPSRTTSRRRGARPGPAITTSPEPRERSTVWDRLELALSLEPGNPLVRYDDHLVLYFLPFRHWAPASFVFGSLATFCTGPDLPRDAAEDRVQVRRLDRGR